MLVASAFAVIAVVFQGCGGDKANTEKTTPEDLNKAIADWNKQAKNNAILTNVQIESELKTTAEIATALQKGVASAKAKIEASKDGDDKKVLDEAKKLLEKVEGLADKAEKAKPKKEETKETKDEAKTETKKEEKNEEPKKEKKTSPNKQGRLEPEKNDS